MINPKAGFVLYARVIVEYDGRAKSVIGPSNLTIIHKPDGSLIIHGANGCLPINYQRPKAVLTLENDRLICKSKAESIAIQLLKVYHYYEITEWSTDKLRMEKTEKQLCNKICSNIDSILLEKITSINREVPVENGAIDILAIDDKEVRHIIEVKRKSATTSAVYQLSRYCEIMKHATCKGYIAAPEIAPKALTLLTTRGYRFLNVDH